MQYELLAKKMDTHVCIDTATAEVENTQDRAQKTFTKLPCSVPNVYHYNKYLNLILQ